MLIINIYFIYWLWVLLINIYFNFRLIFNFLFYHLILFLVVLIMILFIFGYLATSSNKVFYQTKILELIAVKIKSIIIGFLNILPVVVNLFFCKFFNCCFLAEFFYLGICWLLSILKPISVNFNYFHYLPYWLSISYLSWFLHNHFILILNNFIWSSFFVRRWCYILI